MCTLNQAFSYKPDVQAVAATRDGYFPLPDVHRLLRFRAHVDEAQDVVKRSIRKGGSPRFQLSTGENSLLTSSADEDPQKAFPADRCTSKLQRIPVTNGETKFLEDRVLCREAEYFYQVPIHIGELCQGDGVQCPMCAKKTVVCAEVHNNSVRRSEIRHGAASPPAGGTNTGSSTSPPSARARATSVWRARENTRCGGHHARTKHFSPHSLTPRPDRLRGPRAQAEF